MTRAEVGVMQLKKFLVAGGWPRGCGQSMTISFPTNVFRGLTWTLWIDNLWDIVDAHEPKEQTNPPWGMTAKEFEALS
jgi:hypothetical protein